MIERTGTLERSQAISDPHIAEAHTSVVSMQASGLHHLPVGPTVQVSFSRMCEFVDSGRMPSEVSNPAGVTALRISDCGFRINQLHD